MSEPENQEVPPPRYDEPEGVGHRRLIMDEQEWLARPDPWGIDVLPVTVGWRKLLLFNCYLRDRLTAFVQCNICRGRIAEMFDEEVQFINRDSWDIHAWYHSSHGENTPKCDGHRVIRCGIQYQRGIICPSEARNQVVNSLVDVIQDSPFTPEHIQTQAAIRAWYPDIALELVGPNPFRPVTFDATWRSGTVVSLARHIYESRDFGAMPILADALQDAGCEHADILTHCRGNGPHVRGCWVLDLVLGKS